MPPYSLSNPCSDAEFEEYFGFRWLMLRAPWDQPPGSERDAYEQAATTSHVTARLPNGRIIGVGRLHLHDQSHAQIRYMAVDPDRRGIGIGRAMMEELERLAVKRGVQKVLLNSRDHAVEFYKRLNYTPIGAGPTMFGSLPHLRMEKCLTS